MSKIEYIWDDSIKNRIYFETSYRKIYYVMLSLSVLSIIQTTKVETRKV